MLRQCILFLRGTARRLPVILLGAGVFTFGIYNIHAQVGITEGGVIGLMLLLEHWFSLPASVLSPLLDIACYALAFYFLGGGFIGTLLVCSVCVAGCYRVWEQFDPILPSLAGHPLAAAVLGGVFVGVGVGLIVRQGGSAGGDDALAITISRTTGLGLSRCYLFTDITVLALSVSYIPLQNVAASLVTVTVSSYLIGRLAGEVDKQQPHVV